MRERLRLISETVEVGAVQDMGAAQVGIQLEGTLKFPRGGSPIPVAVVRNREQRMRFRLRVVECQCPGGIGFHFWVGFTVRNVGVV